VTGTCTERGDVPCPRGKCARNPFHAHGTEVSGAQQPRGDCDHARSCAQRDHSTEVDQPRCGARTRSGGACQAPVVWDFGTGAPRNGRCRVHGGLSTGAKTPEGRERIAEAQRRRWRRLEEAKAPPRGEGVV
jgi:hypothetical protein